MSYIQSTQWSEKQWERWRKDEYYRSSAGPGRKHVPAAACRSYGRARSAHRRLVQANGEYSQYARDAALIAERSGTISTRDADEACQLFSHANWWKYDRQAFPLITTRASTSSVSPDNNAKSVTEDKGNAKCVQGASWADVSDSDLEEAIPTEQVIFTDIHATRMVEAPAKAPSDGHSRTTGASAELAAKLNKAHEKFILDGDARDVDSCGLLQTLYVSRADADIKKDLQEKIKSLERILEEHVSQLASKDRLILQVQCQSCFPCVPFSCDGVSWQHGEFSPLVPLELVEAPAFSPQPRLDQLEARMSSLDEATQGSLIGQRLEDMNRSFEERFSEAHRKFQELHVQERARAVKRDQIDLLKGFADAGAGLREEFIEFRAATLEKCDTFELALRQSRDDITAMTAELGTGKCADSDPLDRTRLGFLDARADEHSTRLNNQQDLMVQIQFTLSEQHTAYMDTFTKMAKALQSLDDRFDDLSADVSLKDSRTGCTWALAEDSADLKLSALEKGPPAVRSMDESLSASTSTWALAEDSALACEEGVPLDNYRALAEDSAFFTGTPDLRAELPVRERAPPPVLNSGSLAGAGIDLFDAEEDVHEDKFETRSNLSSKSEPLVSVTWNDLHVPGAPPEQILANVCKWAGHTPVPSRLQSEATSEATEHNSDKDPFDDVLDCGDDGEDRLAVTIQKEDLLSLVTHSYLCFFTSKPRNAFKKDRKQPLKIWIASSLEYDPHHEIDTWLRYGKEDFFLLYGLLRPMGPSGSIGLNGYGGSIGPNGEMQNKNFSSLTSSSRHIHSAAKCGSASDED